MYQTGYTVYAKILDKQRINEGIKIIKEYTLLFVWLEFSYHIITLTNKLANPIKKFFLDSKPNNLFLNTLMAILLMQHCEIAFRQ